MAEPAPTSRTGDLLRRAFRIVREDVPAAYARMVAYVPRETLVQIDEDRLVLTPSGDGVEIAADERGESAGEVRVRATTETLLGLIDGATTVLAALLDGSIFVSGDVRTLAEAQLALTAFLQGAVRAPRMVALLDEVRASRAPGASKKPTGREAA